jgi:hypothetical protein
MFIAKKALPRRTFLRTVGSAALGLPLLDAMVPALSALAQTAASPGARLGCFYHPNGTIHADWIPRSVGSSFEFSPILSPLAPVRDQVLVLSGLSHREADSKGDGFNEHPRATAAWLSGVHAWLPNHTESGRVELTTTLDQIAARELSRDLPLTSLELSLEEPEQIACDSGDCFYANTISWRDRTTPLPMETHPRVVFERLFGDGGSPEQRRAQLEQGRSIIDSLREEARRLELELGASDRSKLREYLSSVRDIETRIGNLEKRGFESLDLPNPPASRPELFEDRVQLMFDLIVLAFQTDTTRVFTMLMGRELGAQAFPQIGVPEPAHSVSHHLNKADVMAKKTKVDTFLVSHFSNFLQKMRATPDGDGTLLDHSLLLYGGGLGDGNVHSHDNLPCLLAGGAGGLKGGRHLAFEAGTPKANVFHNVLGRLGLPVEERLGDSSGPLAGV